VLKLSKLLINDIADSADKDVIKYVFCEDCEVYDKDDEDSEDNEDDEENSEDINCEESNWEEDEEKKYWVKIYKT